MATFYVDNQTGNNANSGSLAAPWATIAHALANAAGGDKVYVKGGSPYSLTSTLVFAAADVELEGYTTTPGARDGRPIITSSVSGLNLIQFSAGRCKLVHFTLTHTGSTRGKGVFASITFSNVNINDCVFDGLRRAIDFEHVDHWGIMGALIGSCTIKNSVEYGVSFASGSFTNCEIFGNGGDGWRRGKLYGNFGVTLFQTIVRSNGGFGLNYDSGQDGQINIANSSIVANTSTGIRINNSVGLVGLQMQNSIVWGNGGHGIAAANKLADATQIRTAIGGNTSGNRSNVAAGLLDVALAANPFDVDWKLNTGEGANLKGVGYNRFGSIDGFPDIGHWQSQASASIDGGLADNPLIKGVEMVGDFSPGQTVRIWFNTRKTDGTPITLSGSPAACVYKGADAVESTEGVNLVLNHDGVLGLHLITVATTNAFYVGNEDYVVVLTAGSVNSISVAGSRVGGFSLNNRSALRPTTASRTIEIDPAGKVSVDKTEYALTNAQVTTIRAGLATSSEVNAVAAAAATAILVTPNQKIATDAQNRVSVDKTEYALTNAQVTTIRAGLATSSEVNAVPAASATAILVTPNQKIATDAQNRVSVDKTGYALTDAQITTIRAGLATSSEVNAVPAASATAILVTPNQKIATDSQNRVSVEKTGFSLTDAQVTTIRNGLATSADVTAIPAAAATAVFATTVEGNLDLGETARVLLAATSGRSSGLDTSTARFKSLDGSKDRIIATVDQNGNRSAVTLDPS